jgi:hypothetical protein
MTAVRTFAACALAASLCTGAGPAQGQTLRRIPSERLSVPLPGVAVIRDSAAWRTLWLRFAKLSRRNDVLERPGAPPVRFSDSILVALAPGGANGCSNSLRMVRSIEEHADSVVVRYSSTGLAERGSGTDFMYVTCAAFFTPIDVVALRRTSRLIVFRPAAGQAALPAARWWDRPSMAEIDTMPERTRIAFLDALALDPRVRGRYLVEVARRPVNGWVAELLLGRPEVRGDWRALRAISAHGDELGRIAQRLLIERHGMRLAADPDAPRDLLALVMNDLLDRGSEAQWRANLPRRERRARALAHNPAVLRDYELLGRLTYAAQWLPAVNQEVCAAFLARYPLTREWTADGNQYQFTAHCPSGSGQRI